MLDNKLCTDKAGTILIPPLHLHKLRLENKEALNAASIIKSTIINRKRRYTKINKILLFARITLAITHY